MNILLWAPLGSGEHYWGPGISAFRLYKSGVPKNINLYLAHGYKGQKIYPDLFKDQFYIKGLGNSGGKSVNKIGQVVFSINSYIWINKNFKKFDVVHVLGAFEMQILPSLWFEARGIPTVCKITGTDAGININKSSGLSKLLGISRNRTKNLQKLSGFIAISEEIKNKLINHSVPRNKIHKIPNGVNKSVFKKLNISQKEILRERLSLENKFTILFCGGITRGKQPHLIVKALKELIRNKDFDIQLILLGPDRDNGTEKIKIDKIIKKFKLSNHVYKIGYTKKPYKYYQASDIFCLPSKSEGMSNSLLEAMSSGLPSLVTPISGSKDLITENENGYYVKSVKDIIASIEDLYTNPTKLDKFGNNAREVIEKKYSSDIILDKHFKLFRRVINKKNKNNC